MMIIYGAKDVTTPMEIGFDIINAYGSERTDEYEFHIYKEAGHQLFIEK